MNNVLERARKINTLLRQHRVFINGSLLEYIIVFIFFVTITVIYTDFVAFDISSRLFASIGDGTAGFMWYNFADRNFNLFLSHTDYINYPYGVALGGPIFITYAAILIPMRILSFIFGPMAGLNLVMLWGYIGAGVFGYWLLKRLTSSKLIAMFTGFAIAFVPYSIYKSCNHINYLYSLVFVLILAAFIALWSKPTRSRAIIFAASIALAIYTDGYFILLSAVMVFGLVISGFIHLLVFKSKKIEYLQRFKALVISFICLIILMIPIIYTQINYSGQIKSTLGAARGNIAFDMKYYNLNPADFITPPEGNVLLKIIDSSSVLSNHKTKHSNPSESMAYIGFVLIFLTITGFALMAVWFTNKKKSTINLIKNKKTQRLYVLVGLITFISIPILLSFMFSPEIQIFGKVLPLPGKFLIANNIALWRVMGRFFMVFHVIIAVFAGFTLWVVLNYNKLITKVAKSKPWVIYVIIIILTLLTAFEYYTTANKNGFNINNQPAAYKWLKAQDKIKVIAEFPMVDPLHVNSSIYMTSQLYHGKKMINLKDSMDRQLTNTLGSIKNSEAIDFAYSRGVQAIVTHNTPCEPVSWGLIIFNDSQSMICIYSLDRPVSNDKTFVKYGVGFIYSPNENRPDVAATEIVDGNLNLYFIDQKFNKLKQGKVHFVADISPRARNDFNGTWVIGQNNVIVASGEVTNSKARIDTILSSDSNVAIEIKINGTTIVQGDIELSNVVVTKL